MEPEEQNFSNKFDKPALCQFCSDQPPVFVTFDVDGEVWFLCHNCGLSRYDEPPGFWGGTPPEPDF